MSYQYVDDQKLYELTVEVFRRYGYSEEDCGAIADVLLASDRMGIESHGVQRLIMYVTGIKIGRINKDAVPEIVKETPVSA